MLNISHPNVFLYMCFVAFLLLLFLSFFIFSADREIGGDTVGLRGMVIFNMDSGQGFLYLLVERCLRCWGR